MIKKIINKVRNVLLSKNEYERKLSAHDKRENEYMLKKIQLLSGLYIEAQSESEHYKLELERCELELHASEILLEDRRATVEDLKRITKDLQLRIKEMKDIINGRP